MQTIGHHVSAAISVEGVIFSIFILTFKSLFLEFSNYDSGIKLSFFPFISDDIKEHKIEATTLFISCQYFRLLISFIPFFRF